MSLLRIAIILATMGLSCSSRVCVEDGVGYVGNNIWGAVADTDTWLECSAHCSATDGCAVWEWWDSGVCFPMTRKGEREERDFAISGAADCHRQSGCDVEDGVYYGGNYIPGANKGTETWQECRAHCSATDGCEVWTWIKSTKDCYPLPSKGERYQSNNYISGPAGCPTPPPTTTGTTTTTPTTTTTSPTTTTTTPTPLASEPGDCPKPESCAVEVIEEVRKKLAVFKGNIGQSTDLDGTKAFIQRATMEYIAEREEVDACRQKEREVFERIKRPLWALVNTTIFEADGQAHQTKMVIDKINADLIRGRKEYCCSVNGDVE